jgi:hypothetical protein
VSQTFEGATWRTVIEHLPGAAHDDRIVETASVFTVRVPSSMPLDAGSPVVVELSGPAHVFAETR